MTYNVAHVTADPEIQLLNRLGGLFTSSLSLNENIEAMLQATSQMMQFDAATVFFLNEGSRELTACATYPHQDMVPHIAHFVLGEGILGYAVEQLETLISPTPPSIPGSRSSTRAVHRGPSWCSRWPRRSGSSAP